jgi:hypothetical protein
MQYKSVGEVAYESRRIVNSSRKKTCAISRTNYKELNRQILTESISNADYCPFIKILFGSFGLFKFSTKLLLNWVASIHYNATVRISKEVNNEAHKTSQALPNAMVSLQHSVRAHYNLQPSRLFAKFKVTRNSLL